jgi:hypothetical protein
MQLVYFKTLTLGYVVVYLKTLRAAENNVSPLISTSIFNVRFYVTSNKRQRLKMRCITGIRETKHLAETGKQIPPFYATGRLATVLIVVHAAV